MAERFDHADALAMFAAGATYAETAATYGVTTQAIYRLVVAEAPHLLGRKTGVRPSYDHEAAIKLYAAGGKTYKQVGAVFGVSGVSVHMAVKKHAPHLLPRRVDDAQAA